MAARLRRTDPPASLQDRCHHSGEPARLEDLCPARPERDVVVHSRIEVPLQVGPPVDGIAVTECSIELDQGALASVADVAVHRPAGRVLTELSLAFKETWARSTSRR
ncbi:hypothetical protein CFI00_05595 [Nocardioides sp. S5]|uniref:hypothetical protein n=1 Tax=Nocardioides sp. S5 TaxID=2017486 RepID=UPI001A8C4591|nr:hypothetical protein [Nocardioides sp. S5]QSR29992.1 hypothetical protein CFI00_05595 [Nocardioides sp. S5]